MVKGDSDTGHIYVAVGSPIKTRGNFFWEVCSLRQDHWMQHVRKA